MMVNMTTITKDYLNISQTLKNLVEEVEPIKERFYNFLNEHKPYGSGFPDYLLEAYDYKSPLSDYVLNVWELEAGSGLTFETEVHDYDVSETLRFTIPDAYLEDPDVFEAAIIAHQQEELTAAKKVVAGIFGEEVINEVEVKAYTFDFANGGYDSDKKFLIIDVAPLPGKRPGRNATDNFMLNMSRSYAWDTADGKFYYGGWSAAYDVVKNGDKEVLGEVIL